MTPGQIGGKTRTPTLLNVPPHARVQAEDAAAAHVVPAQQHHFLGFPVAAAAPAAQNQYQHDEELVSTLLAMFGDGATRDACVRALNATGARVEGEAARGNALMMAMEFLQNPDFLADSHMNDPVAPPAPPRHHHAAAHHAGQHAAQAQLAGAQLCGGAPGRGRAPTEGERNEAFPRVAAYVPWAEERHVRQALRDVPWVDPRGATSVVEAVANDAINWLLREGRADELHAADLEQQERRGVLAEQELEAALAASADAARRDERVAAEAAAAAAAPAERPASVFHFRDPHGVTDVTPSRT